MTIKSFKLHAEEFGESKLYTLPPAKIKEKLKEVTVVDSPTEEIKNLLDSIEKNKIAFDKAEASLEAVNAEIKRISLELGKGEKTVEKQKQLVALNTALSATTKLLYNINTAENESNKAYAHNNRIFVLLEEPGKVELPPATVDKFMEFVKTKDVKLASALSKWHKKFPVFLESLAEVKKSVVSGYSVERTKSVEELLKRSHNKTAADDVVESFKLMFNSIKDLFTSTDEILRSAMELDNEVAELEEKLRAGL